VQQKIAFPAADITLAKRLERAEAHACAQYAVARRSVRPDSGAEWIEVSRTYAVFDGVDSPVTQTFGLGLFEELTSAHLDAIEAFFDKHGAPIFHEVSPFAGIATLQLLCKRGYEPIERSNLLYRPVAEPNASSDPIATARVLRDGEAQLWSEISAQGWATEHPEFYDFLLQLGVISAARSDSTCFIAELEGVPGAAGVLSMHEGVALFGGSSTLPALRNKGLQTALLRERMKYALDHGCDLAMMVAQPGTASQRNAERQGFRIAYTRTKWQLRHPDRPTTV
jgi:GNAT superfamily N-acetyltransferase